ncbi:unnamed protein product [Diamesa serratosioi]
MTAEVLNYIKVKKQYTKDGFHLFYLFETAYVPSGQHLYIKKLKGLNTKCEDEDVDYKTIINYLKCAFLQKSATQYEPMINLLHTGSESGFLGDIIFLDELAKENESLDISLKKTWITDQWEKILKQLPDKSVLIMTKEKHYMIKAKYSRKQNENLSLNKSKSKNVTTRERQAQMKGQMKITCFFKATKSSSGSSIPKKSFIKKPIDSNPEFKIEMMARILRGDSVKVLWLPKNYRELNPSEFVKIFLLNNIAVMQEGYWCETEDGSKDENEITPTSSQQSIDLFQIISYEPMISNPLNPENIELDCIEDNSNDSSDSDGAGIIFKNKLKGFCSQAFKDLDSSTWKQAIDFVENLENYYEKTLL